jgi:hypothetical protein
MVENLTSDRVSPLTRSGATIVCNPLELEFGRQFVPASCTGPHIAQDQAIRAQVSTRKIAIEG